MPEYDEREHTDSEKELLDIKDKVDSTGYTEFKFADDSYLCEIEKIRDRYKISFYKGIEECELLKTFRVSKFPDSEWWHAKANSVILNKFFSTLGL